MEQEGLRQTTHSDAHVIGYDLNQDTEKDTQVIMDIATTLSHSPW